MSDRAVILFGGWKPPTKKGGTAFLSLSQNRNFKRELNQRTYVFDLQTKLAFYFILFYSILFYFLLFSSIFFYFMFWFCYFILILTKFRSISFSHSFSQKMESPQNLCPPSFLWNR